MDGGLEVGAAHLANEDLVWRLACGALDVDVIEYDPTLDGLQWSADGPLHRFMHPANDQANLEHLLERLDPAQRHWLEQEIGKGREFELRLSPSFWVHWRPLKALRGIFYVCSETSETHRLRTQLGDVIQSERQKFAECLHDDLCQHLVGIGILTQRLNQMLEKRGAAEAEELQEVCGFLKEAVDKTRALSRGLSNPSGCLPQKLEGLAADVQKLFKIPCQLELRYPWPDLNQNKEAELFLILREAIYNAAKHSCGSLIEIMAGPEGKRLVFVVEDNGIGISSGNEQGMGLGLMKQRALSIGAQLWIGSGEAGGTKMVCELPL